MAVPGPVLGVVMLAAFEQVSLGVAVAAAADVAVVVAAVADAGAGGSQIVAVTLV